MRIKLFKFFRAVIGFTFVILLIGFFNLIINNPHTRDNNLVLVILGLIMFVIVGIREFLDTLIIQIKEKEDKVSSIDRS